MRIALCYESILPARGGCETYIVDLTRRLCADGHAVHLYCSRWDAQAVPAVATIHALPIPAGPRCLRPWLFGRACLRALQRNEHDVSVGFDKTWGQDVLYPQGGLHVASAEYGLRKFESKAWRLLAALAKKVDLASNSFRVLERRQYSGQPRPLLVANSRMVQEHFVRFYGIAADAIHVVPNGVHPERFVAHDRAVRRHEWRQRWQVDEQTPLALFVAMNYRLKGLEPLLQAVRLVPRHVPLRIAVVGHPNTGAYKRRAARMGIADRMIFHGYCAEPHHAYFAADFLVHPTFYDPCSLVVLEALACGLPVITTQYNGAAELLDPPAAGLVVKDPHDHAELARCLVRFADSGHRQVAAAAAYQAARRWTFADHYQRITKVLSLAAERRASGSLTLLRRAS